MKNPGKPDDPGVEHCTKTVGYDQFRTAADATDRSQRVMEIEVVGGPMDGQSVTVGGSVVTIGRAGGNDLCLGRDVTVSTRHARIIREQDSFWLEDLGSTNGTYLGQQRIRDRTPIGPGTLLKVGSTSLEFSPR